MTDAATALANAPPFDALDHSERRRLDELGHTLSVAEGQIIWEQGRELDGAYIILEGSLFERRPDRVVVHQAAGDIAGISAWIGGTRTEYAAKAASDSRLLLLSGDAFRQLVEERTALGRTLLDLVIRELVGRVRELNQTLNELVAGAHAEH